MTRGKQYGAASATASPHIGISCRASSARSFFTRHQTVLQSGISDGHAMLLGCGELGFGVYGPSSVYEPGTLQDSLESRSFSPTSAAWWELQTPEPEGGKPRPQNPFTL